MLCNCCLWQATVHYALGSQHKHSMTCHTLLTICQMFTHTKSSQEALVSVFTLLGQMYGVRIQVTDPESKELLLQQLNNHVAIKMKLVLSPLRPWQPDSRAHPAEMPHLQHAEEDSETSGDPPADHILLPLAETGDGSSICSIILVITDDKEEQVGAAAAGVEPVPVQQHEEQWYLYQSSNTKSSGTCTSPATQRAVEPVPVQQHIEQWNLYQSSNTKSSGTCTSPATWREWILYQSSNTNSCGTCTSPATWRAVEPVPVQQHEEQWNLYQSSNTKSSGTCTSPATWREWNMYQSSNTKNRNIKSSLPSLLDPLSVHHFHSCSNWQMLALHLQ